MKPLFSIIFALCSLSFSVNAKTIKIPIRPLYNYDMIHYAPLLMYGTVREIKTDERNNIIAKLAVKSVIKGDLAAAKNIIVHFPAYTGRYKNPTPPQTTTTLNETAIFALYKNNQNEWATSSWGIEGRIDVNASGKVQILDKTYTIPDFKAGIALFDAQYTYFQEKQANNTSIVLENPTKNQTFAFLAKEMMGNLIYTPKIIRKATGKRQKVLKKKRNYRVVG